MATSGPGGKAAALAGGKAGIAAAHLEELPDVVFTVHGLQLEESVLRTLQQERRPHVWVDVDPLGKEFELGLNLRSKRVRASVRTSTWWSGVHARLRSSHAARSVRP